MYRILNRLDVIENAVYRSATHNGIQVPVKTLDGATFTLAFLPTESFEEFKSKLDARLGYESRIIVVPPRHRQFQQQLETGPYNYQYFESHPGTMLHVMPRKRSRTSSTTLVVKKVTGELLHFSVAADGSTTLSEILQLYAISGRFVCAGRELNPSVPINEAGEGLEDGPDLRNLTIGSVYYVGSDL